MGEEGFKVVDNLRTWGKGQFLANWCERILWKVPNNAKIERFHRSS